MGKKMSEVPGLESETYTMTFYHYSSHLVPRIDTQYCNALHKRQMRRTDVLLVVSEPRILRNKGQGLNTETKGVPPRTYRRCASHPRRYHQHLPHPEDTPRVQRLT